MVCEYEANEVGLVQSVEEGKCCAPGISDFFVSAMGTNFEALEDEGLRTDVLDVVAG